MRALRFFKTVPGFLLSVIVSMGLLTTAAVYAVDGDPPGLFQLDGDADETMSPIGGSTNGDDWNLLYNGGSNDGGSPIAFTTIVADPAPTSIFWKGGTKDIHDLDGWWHKDGSVPDKDDITNAYAAAYLSPDEACRDPDNHAMEVTCGDGTEGVDWEYIRQVDDLIIYFGFDRYSNDGDAFGGFWFFQNPVCDDEAGFESRFTDCSDTGTLATHVAKTLTSPGDLLLLVEYPQGSNATPVIKAYEWDPNDVDGDGNLDSDGGKLGNLDQAFSSEDELAVSSICDQMNLKIACAITNDEVDGIGNEIGEIDVDWDYTPKSGTFGSPPYESFFEGGVNVTQLLGDTLCVSSFLAESRASRSEDAILKDYVLSDFNVCSATIETEIHAEPGHSNNVDGGSIDVGTTVHDAAYLSIIGPPGVEAPTGYVRFERFNNANCSAPAAFTEDVNLNTGVTVNGELRVESSSYTPPGASSLSYKATYLGDNNYAAVFFRCETVDVNKYNAAISTEIHAGSGADGSHSTSDIQAGVGSGKVTATTIIHDLGKVTGPAGSPEPTGNVNFTFYGDDSCNTEIAANSSASNLATGPEAGAITNGRKVASADFDTTGYVTSGTERWLSYRADYEGDSNYEPITDTVCEKLLVEKLTPTVVTEIHSGARDGSHTFGTGLDIQDTDFTVGGILHDMAKVSGSGPAPTGNVEFKFYTTDTCSAESEVAANSSTQSLVATATDGVALAESSDFDTSGYVPSGSTTKVLAYKAFYAGDDVYIAANESTCEDLRVVKRLPSLITRVIVQDEAQLFGDGLVTPTGNIDFRIYNGTGCTGEPFLTLDDRPLDSNLVAMLPDSAKQVLATSGSISYLADYDGDDNYVPVTHACENVTVELPGASTGTL